MGIGLNNRTESRSLITFDTNQEIQDMFGLNEFDQMVKIDICI